MGEIVKVEFKDFALAQPDADQALEIIRQNAGSGGLTQFDLDRIKVPAGGGVQWKIPDIDGDKYVDNFDAVILHWFDARRYWAQSFGESASGPPDCSSDDCNMGIGTPGGACGTCQFAQFGSADKGKGQACKQTRIMFLMRQEEILPAVIAVPPTSLGDCRKLFLRLASRATPFFGVVMNFALVQKTNAGGVDYAEIAMKVTSKLTAEEAEKTKSIRDEMMPAFQKVSIDRGDVGGESKGGGDFGDDPQSADADDF